MVIRRDGSPSMFPGALLFAPYVSLLRAVSMHLSLSSVCFSPLSHFSSSSCRSSFSLFLTLYSLIFSLSQLFLYISSSSYDVILKNPAIVTASALGCTQIGLQLILAEGGLLF